METEAEHRMIQQDGCASTGSGVLIELCGLDLELPHKYTPSAAEKNPRWIVLRKGRRGYLCFLLALGSNCR